MSEKEITERVCNILKKNGIDAVWQMVDYDEDEGVGEIHLVIGLMPEEESHLLKGEAE